MKKNLFYSTNEEEWTMENRLKEKGFVKTSDCYWVQIFQKDTKTIILNRK